MKSQGFFQTPQDIMGEYDGCSVAQYTAYPLMTRLYRGFRLGSAESIILRNVDLINPYCTSTVSYNLVT